jgi:hypothetical protein
MDSVFIEALHTRDVGQFLKLMWPEHWQGAAARILETGVDFDADMCDWAPRWSKIPLTFRQGKTELETAIKTCMFRIHDCFHQLWGTPIPGVNFTEEDFYVFKRSIMCGEVAVLTMSEFACARHLVETFPESESFIMKRNALKMWEGPLKHKTIQEVAARMDGLLHKKVRPKWLRDDPASTAFANDYVPMLENDRDNIDLNWKLMKESDWHPIGAPNSRYNQQLDGLELTTWMVNDFYHQIQTDPVVDEPLRDFNKSRRSTIVLPKGWNGIPFIRSNYGME